MAIITNQLSKPPKGCKPWETAIGQAQVRSQHGRAWLFDTEQVNHSWLVQGLAEDDQELLAGCARIIPYIVHGRIRHRSQIVQGPIGGSVRDQSRIDRGLINDRSGIDHGLMRDRLGTSWDRDRSGRSQQCPGA